MELLYKYPITGSAEFEFARLTYHESISLIRIEFTHDLVFTLKEVTLIFETSQQFSGGKPYHTLSVVDVRLKPDREIYDFMASKERQNRVLSEAFVLPSGSLRILYNFYQRIKKPRIPTRAFKTEDEALNWLLPGISAQNK
ncbi:MAG: hypothetical protein ACRC3B_10670 [Bacteroidia bacterium]